MALREHLASVSASREPVIACSGNMECPGRPVLMGGMFDPALLSALEMPAPPSSPVMAEERLWLSPAGEKAQRLADRTAAGYEDYARMWKARVEKVRAGSALMPSNPFTAEERAQIDALIEDCEAFAEERAVAAARVAKRAAKDIKRDFAIDPSIGAVRRTFSERLLRIDQDIIETILDYALFLRAFRAERAPEARGGPTFEDTAELSRYLDVQLA